MSNNKSQTASSIVSVIFSFLASSHHTLHMIILFILGGSTSIMNTMSSVIWLRRFMIVVTLVMAFISLYRLYKHQYKKKWIFYLTLISLTISLGFIVYTLIRFGW